MNKPVEIEELNPNSEQSRNVSLIKDFNHTEPELNPTVSLFNAQMLKSGWRKKILMKNGDKVVFEPEFVPMSLAWWQRNLLESGRKVKTCLMGGSTKMTTQFFQCSFISVRVFIWHPNAGVG